VLWQNRSGEAVSEVTIALLRCDGGEEVDRFTSADPALLRFVESRGGRSG
jgi:hypothetical protein